MTDLQELYLKDIEFLSSMTVKERVLYRKWYEINDKFKIINKCDGFFYFEDEITLKNQPLIDEIKKELWAFNEPTDYLKINPIIIHCNTKEKKKKWDLMRVFCSSHIWNGIPGKIQKFYVIDEYSNKIIGFFALSSDLKDIGGRNDYIGWSKEDRYSGMLDYIAIGSTIIPTQPFGFNFIGGKLLALLICSEPVVKIWEDFYNKPLAGITTSSLYGSQSQYNSLPYWKKCKTSEGKNFLKPSPHVWKLCQQYVKENYPNKIKWLNYDSVILPIINKDFNIKKYFNYEPRGVYFNCLYNNTKEFLCRKDDTLKEKKYNNSIEEMISIWRKKCANRVKSLLKRNGFINNTLFYDDMIYLTWEECKEKYLKKI